MFIALKTPIKSCRSVRHLTLRVYSLERALRRYRADRPPGITESSVHRCPMPFGQSLVTHLTGSDPHVQPQPFWWITRRHARTLFAERYKC